MTPPLLEKIIEGCSRARSLLCMFQLQDLLDLDESLLAADPKADRINVPGTVTEENWTWRMPLALEELPRMTALAGKIRALAAARRERPPEEALQ
jgi:4-alpha-glucanotransferase